MSEMEPMTGGHDCFDYRARVVLNEGDDVFVEQCQACGKIRMENGDGRRPMGWYRAPSLIDPSHTWQYVWDDPSVSDDEEAEVWKTLEEVEHGG